jgi:hypothetical protein
VTFSLGEGVTQNGESRHLRPGGGFSFASLVNLGTARTGITLRFEGSAPNATPPSDMFRSGGVVRFRELDASNGLRFKRKREGSLARAVA